MGLYTIPVELPKINWDDNPFEDFDKLVDNDRHAFDASGGHSKFGSGGGARLCHTAPASLKHLCKLRDLTDKEKKFILEVIEGLPDLPVCKAIGTKLRLILDAGRIKVFDNYIPLAAGQFLDGDIILDGDTETGGAEIHIYTGKATDWFIDPGAVIHEGGHATGLEHPAGQFDLPQVASCGGN